MSDHLTMLRELERKILWLACWTVQNANHLWPEQKGVAAFCVAPRSSRISWTCQQGKPSVFSKEGSFPASGCGIFGVVGRRP